MRLYDVTGCTAKIAQPDTNLAVYGQQVKPFALCNASLYNGMSTTVRPSGPPIGTIIEGGKLIHNDGNGFGCGIQQGKDALQFGEPWDCMWTNYLTGYNSPVQGGVYVAPTHKDSYVFDCRLSRIAIGARGKQTYIVTDDGVTLREFAQNAIAGGLDTLVNLDGGGSRHLLYNGTLVYQSPRVPYNAIAFFKDEKTEPQKNECPYPEPTRNLLIGCRGKDVQWLQWQLAKRGYDVGQIDGIFGWQTWRAVWAFQKTWTKPDGICGINTRGELKK